MSNVGLLTFQFIPIILGTLILAYSDWKIVGIISIVFGLCCVAYSVSQPCIKCYGGASASDNPDYQSAVRSARYTTMLLFIIGIGFALLIWNFVGHTPSRSKVSVVCGADCDRRSPSKAGPRIAPQKTDLAESR